jgi:hypothetical protein
LDQEILDAVLDDWQTAPVPERTRAALGLLERMTCKPNTIEDSYIDRLLDEGLSRLEIQEAANVGFHYNLIDRVADAFDFPIPEGIHLKRLARMLNFTGKLLRGSPAEESWVIGEDGVKRPPEVELGRKRLLETPGATSPGLKRAVEAYVMGKWNVDRESRDVLPHDLEPYLNKLAQQAYKIVDQDFDDLRGAGYSEEMLYEITIVGATAAALVGLETLYQVLY